MIRNILRTEVRDAEQLFHGEIMMEEASKYGIPKDKILDFSTNVNPLGPPPSVIKSIRKNIRAISQYPPHQPEELRRALAEHYGSSEEKIVIGNGCTELIYLLAYMFLNKGEEATIAEPTFTEYSKAAKIGGGKVRSVRLKNDNNFEPELEVIQEKISHRTKLVFLCSPNNPSGRMIPFETLRGILETCEDFDALVALDEAFYEYCDHPQKYNVAEMEFNNLISLRSLTKFYSLAGLRIGIAIAPLSVPKAMWGAQVRWNVNSLAQLAAKVAIKDSKFFSRTKEKTKEGKEFLLRELKKFERLKVYPSDSNFFLINISKTESTSTQLAKKLLQRGILIRNCGDFKFLDENYIRISTRPKKDCKRLIKNMKRMMLD